MKKLLVALFLATSLTASAQPRIAIQLRDWQFKKGGESAWQSVKVPHDWAISGPFDKKWDLQNVAIEQNGEKEKTEKSGRSGALPWIGTGVYETRFDAPKKLKHAELYFDGAMAEPKVYVNDTFVGEWKYGYNAFRLDISDALQKKDNVIRVELQNVEESNRWYPGAGLYRPVQLIFTSDASIDTWGTFFRTLNISGNDRHDAQVALDVKVKSAKKMKNMKVVAALEGENGTTQDIKIGDDGSGTATFSVGNARLWSPEEPNLYTLRLKLYKGNRLMDETVQRVGIRTISIDKERGFCLNGVSRKFKGVCLHHDLGPLGAAVNRSALIRQIRIMKEMGADAIRTSHNMPSQMQMEVCDSMGMMVMAESFDAWKDKKVKNGYNRFYDEWWQRDITNLVLGHRNHPSIVMWSIGNEIPEQWKKEGAQRAKNMVELCHQLDPTRTVTCGVDQPEGASASGFFDAVDVPGFNYRTHLYDKVFPKLKQGFLLGSETASTVSSRGVYKMPMTEEKNKAYADGQCSSYDTEYCWWSNLPDDDFTLQDDRAWTIGQFVWTGFDYLGEPTPYDEYWPSRSSYFGIVDLAGLPKDRYWLYRSQWKKDSHTLHLLPHWTWQGMEGKGITVVCYTDYPQAELYVNGKSYGCRELGDTAHLHRYRLIWDNVLYEPGELRVVAFDANGNKAATEAIRTAGEPAQILLSPDVKSLRETGDLAFVTVSIADKYGNICPDADDAIDFRVTGGGTFKAVCNGDATSLESFTSPTMRLFKGQLVVVVEADKTSSEPAVLTVTCAKRNLSKQIIIPQK